MNVEVIRLETWIIAVVVIIIVVVIVVVAGISSCERERGEDVK